MRKLITKNNNASARKVKNYEAASAAPASGSSCCRVPSSGEAIIGMYTYNEVEGKWEVDVQQLEVGRIVSSDVPYEVEPAILPEWSEEEDTKMHACDGG